MRVIFCGYRDWSFNVLESLKKKYEDKHQIFLAKNPEELNLYFKDGCDVVLAIGWSWRIPDEIIDSCFVAGMHPSDLPEYAGGSPIQHQVLDGITRTKATLFRLRKEMDAGEIIDKENLSLEGQIGEILKSIEASTVSLLIRFIDAFPDITMKKQNKEKLKIKKRLKPESGKIELPDGFSCASLWDFIRCRGEPYPDAYFEDETGKIEIKSVKFIKKIHPGDK